MIELYGDFLFANDDLAKQRQGQRSSIDAKNSMMLKLVVLLIKKAIEVNQRI
jgi:hypothetical protein